MALLQRFYILEPHYLRGFLYYFTSNEHPLPSLSYEYLSRTLVFICCSNYPLKYLHNYQRG